MEEVFLKSIKVNSVRHLADMEIPLSENERKHLILTGKNGSGKTSILEKLRDYCEGYENNQIHMDAWREGLNGNLQAVDRYKKMPHLLDLEKVHLGQLERTVSSYATALAKYSNLELQINNYEILNPLIQAQQFMFVYFPAKRGSKYVIASGPKKLGIEHETYSINKNFNQNFLQYLVNLRTERSFAKDDNDKSSYQAIDRWFMEFENMLGEIYGQNLDLEFDRKDWNFYILLKGHERFDLNHLSDGYAAIINIVSELLLRMEKTGLYGHEMQGIALIDEIETHLHISLQRKILPFLTSFFPKIQFIVTTHSPFVLSSINNAVIFDLEKKERVEDMSGYSAESIIESYFDADQYSDLVKKKVKEYEALSESEKLSLDDAKRLKELEIYFNKFPYSLSPELSLKINNIRLKKIA